MPVFEALGSVGGRQKHGSSYVPGGEHSSPPHRIEVYLLVGAEGASKRRCFHRGSWKTVGLPGGAEEDRSSSTSEKLVLGK